MDDNQNKWVVRSDILDKKVAVIGFYNSDSRDYSKYLLSLGVEVIIGIKDEDVDARQQALEEGFTVTNIIEAVRRADIVQVW